MSKRHSDETISGKEESNGEGLLSEPRTKQLTSPLKKPKLAFSIGKKPNQDNKTLGVDLKVKDSLKAAFNSESEEEEEVPKEAIMRMRNIGRDTPTSAGPKSFGKTKQGFCDAKRVFEKTLKEVVDNLEEDQDDNDQDPDDSDDYYD